MDVMREVYIKRWMRHHNGSRKQAIEELNMPIYTFFCKSCNQEFDAIVPYDTKSRTCDCGKSAKRTGTEVPAKRNPEHGLQR